MSLILADGRDARMLRLDHGAPLGLGEHPYPPLQPARVWLVKHKHELVKVIASVDDGALHVSISHSHRYPTWDEIRAVRDWAFPEETEVVMVLARKSEYVNLHPNCFHLWESACGREGR